MIKEKADGGDELAKGVQDTFGEKPDSLLVRFIRARKYDVPRAFELMKGTSGHHLSTRKLLILSHESRMKDSNHEHANLCV